MANSPAFIDYLLDQLSQQRSVTSRRMFGGHGFFCDQLMFALVVDDQLYLKADHALADCFLQCGCQQFTYLKQGKSVQINYYTVPEQAMDDADLLNQWAELSVQVARAQAA
ncbi:TfoX/Sxy family protein [Pontibacter sp. JAM-7]|uniref:TfoX/Sxy family protein n=1 Tax=Pontibacter sp. JAM-7 TaxID=3366581 RepID=UPI003AF9B8FC